MLINNSLRLSEVYQYRFNLYFSTHTFKSKHNKIYKYHPYLMMGLISVTSNTTTLLYLPHRI